MADKALTSLAVLTKRIALPARITFLEPPSGISSKDPTSLAPVVGPLRITGKRYCKAGRTTPAHAAKSPPRITQLKKSRRDTDFSGSESFAGALGVKGSVIPFYLFRFVDF